MILAKGVPEKQFADESGHWYTASGDPMYTVVGANGKVRNTTLADARKLHLFPSVTTVAQIEAKPALTRWLVEQGMLACLTLPRNPGENEHDFMARALDDSKAQTQKAAERGSYLHGRLEDSVRANKFVGENEDWVYIDPVLGWLWNNFPGYTWSVERSVASRYGFGGKIDLTGTHPTLSPVVMDYKCKDFKPENKKKLAYVEHVTQLAAYAQALYMIPGEVRCINLFISSTVPGLFEVKEWEKKEIIQGWRAFEAMLNLWQIRKDYYPCSS